MNRKMTMFGRVALAAVMLLVTMIGVGVKSASALTFARSVTANFQSASTGPVIALRNGEQFTYQVLSGNNPNVGTVELEKSCNGLDFGHFSTTISTINNSAAGTFSGTIPVEDCARGVSWLRFHQTAYTSGTSSTTITEADNVLQSFYNNQRQSVIDIKDGGVVVNGYLNATSSTTIAAGAIDTPKLNSDAVTSAKILNGTIDTPKLATDSVTSTAIRTGSVGTVKIATVAGDSAKIMVSCAGVALWRTGGTCP